MAAAQNTPGRAEPIERFRPTSGQFVGHLTLAAIAVLLVYLAFTTNTVDGLRVGTGLLLFGVLVWAVLLRPRATAYPDELHILNSFRDVVIPYASIDRVTVGRFLSVWVGDDRFVCTGIGRTGIGRPGRQAVPGGNHAGRFGYADFVLDRLSSLAEDARRQATASDGTTDPAPRQVWAWPELLGLLVSGTAFVLSLSLR